MKFWAFLLTAAFTMAVAGVLAEPSAAKPVRMQNPASRADQILPRVVTKLKFVNETGPVNGIIYRAPSNSGQLVRVSAYLEGPVEGHLNNMQGDVQLSILWDDDYLPITDTLNDDGTTPLTIDLGSNGAGLGMGLLGPAELSAPIRLKAGGTLSFFAGTNSAANRVPLLTPYSLYITVELLEQDNG